MEIILTQQNYVFFLISIMKKLEETTNAIQTDFLLSYIFY